MFLAISRMHQDKRSDLEQEIKDLESRYDRAKKDEQTLIGQRESLRALQSERPHPSEWTVNERNFVLQMSRESLSLPISFQPFFRNATQSQRKDCNRYR